MYFQQHECLLLFEEIKSRQGPAFKIFSEAELQDATSMGSASIEWWAAGATENMNGRQRAPQERVWQGDANPFPHQSQEHRQASCSGDASRY